MNKTENKLILSIAVPAVLQTVIRSSFSFVDAFFVGQLGSVQLAGLSVATFLVWGLLSLAEIIPVGTNSLIAQSVGAKNLTLSKKLATSNLVNAFFNAAILGFILLPVLPYLYDLIALDSRQRIFASEYLVTIMIGLPCLILQTTVSAIFRGYGDTKTPFYLLLLSVLLNLILTPALTFGVDGFFRYEMRGAAIATLISYFISFVVGFVLLIHRNLRSKLKTYKFEGEILKETFRIGLPLALNGLAFSMIYVFVSRFVSDYGTTGLAALGIGHRSESIAYQICVGFSLAATILVGQKVGAGKTDDAERIAWKILWLSLVIVFIYSVPLFIFSAEIASIFSDDHSVINAASTYNKVAAAVLIFSAAEVILSGAFSGAGDTVPPAVVGLPFNILRIPFSAIFTPIFGLEGVWIAISLTVFLKGVIMVVWFKRGKWKNKRSKLLEREKKNLLELTEIE
ncbi:MAG: MATE family efflux transporter [Ignavibacteriaceae bacterium]|jgi:putative MATE family efflux protein|nr:MAG: MATE family efflux transporter [Chlorobiota bacterium]KXK01841.1 MAG: Na+-driven multidrug efflux pump [Chlorobi bacterium OLB4]MBV6399353.1 Multidrug export protein MepA [Ignavibacteria bacterium]MCC6886798.1 MATE family efflux transporter [Ignavibacteriales bacterium]MCE7953735.1 MATE family efflux transporter [Chlorobi bacterium CHB7]MDL1887669.1 MATE family efflux transporter [Ignavibacteria bacterium CHB1]MEB2329890.1 MATE family efflux transporter [Ignavibacteriaceae bacterium]